MFKVVLKDFSDTIHETKIFHSLEEAELLVKHWYELTSGAVRGFIEEVEALPEKIVKAVEAKKDNVEVAVKTDVSAAELDIKEDAKKVLDKA